MLEYTEKLKRTMLKQGFSIDYVEQCTSYASKLLNKGLPVIFNRDHFSKLVGITLPELEKLLTNDNYRKVRIPKKWKKNIIDSESKTQVCSKMDVNKSYQ